MAHNVDARYDDTDFSFLPPTRTLGFNAQLTMNDSLLVQSYIEAYDISYPEAEARIADEVRFLRQILETEGRYELNDLGVLFLNNEGKYEFEPCESGLLTPSLYGFGAFTMQPLGQVSTNTESSKTTHVPTAYEPEDTQTSIPFTTTIPTIPNTSADAQTSLSEDEEEEVPSTTIVSLRAIRYFAAACVMFAIFLIFPGKLSAPQQNSTSQGAIDTGLLSAVFSRETSVPTPQIIQNDSVTPSSAAPKNDVAKSEIKNISHPSTCYVVVLASHITLKNAKSYIASLRQQGYDEVSIHPGKHVKVVYGNFTSKEEAQQALSQHQNEAAFKGAWITTISR